MADIDLSSGEDRSLEMDVRRTSSCSEVVSNNSSLVSRKVSCAFSETDSGVDVENDEDSIENSVEKKMIRPDQDIISRLCNFDEEEEDEITDVSDNDDHDDHDNVPDNKVNLSLLELKHIMSSLVLEHIEVGSNQGNCKQELTIQIEWRQICLLSFAYQSQIVSEDA